jgi:perosamine synthetase
MQFAEVIVKTLHRAIGAGPVVLHEPWFKGNEWSYVKDCIDTGWVSSVGSYVDRFERDLAEKTGCNHAVAVANGTAGLQVALEVCGVEPGDEVIVPALSFVATANAVKHCGAEPHFADSDRATLGLDVASLSDHLSDLAVMRGGRCYNSRSGRRIAAVVPMHTFGHPVDMPALVELAARYDITVVEDAAESLGSLIGGRHTGTFGRCGVLSFNGNKIVTTGGGGAIVTNDPRVAQRAKHLTTTARRPHRWAFLHDEVGYNFRMPNLNAALGCAQLERLEEFVGLKRQLAERYRLAFADVDGATLFLERPGTRVNYWLQTLILDESVADQRDLILAATNDAGLMTRPVWELLSHLPMYRECESMPIPTAEVLARCIVNLPSGPQLVAVPP